MGFQRPAEEKLHATCMCLSIEIFIFAIQAMGIPEGFAVLTKYVLY